ncbi:hypothetical protein [Rhodococcus sp. A5(2022)]|uniref:hypothetical protein n=1 Tax=Rhodococcus sp. A5(2022) TaxID=3003588 RepID=UPI0022A87F13|nr:hypothetical protein [Rhodococcus sp. A5(2022)]MCZ1075612.1 hypothetical protein [Rhodococcus sp. A5(2022)]
MTTAHQRPDLAACNDAARMTRSELVTALRELLGVELVAYLWKARETRAVRQWAEGARTINNETDVERLRIAYRAARLIAERDTPPWPGAQGHRGKTGVGSAPRWSWQFVSEKADTGLGARCGVPGI